MAWYSCNAQGLSQVPDNYYIPTGIPSGVDPRTYLTVQGFYSIDGISEAGTNQIIFDNGLLQILINTQIYNNRINQTSLILKSKQTGNFIGVGNRNCYGYYIGLGYNDETHRVKAFMVGKRTYNNEWTYYITDFIGNAQQNEDVYQAVLGSVVPLYQWSSVPAISGKNGILLPMSTLNDINDGNEVTTSDTSKFNLNDRSNIKNLVDAVVNDF